MTHPAPRPCNDNHRRAVRRNDPPLSAVICALGFLAVYVSVIAVLLYLARGL